MKNYYPIILPDIYDLILDGDYFKVSSSSQFDIFKKNKKLISINSDKVRLFV